MCICFRKLKPGPAPSGRVGPPCPLMLLTGSGGQHWHSDSESNLKRGPAAATVTARGGRRSAELATGSPRPNCRAYLTVRV